MRRFSLVNSQGLEYNLTDSTVFFAEVSGLGIEREDTYRAVGNRYVRVSKVMSLGTIPGKLYFYGNKPYDQYREFVNFATQEPLYLKYTPDETSFTYSTIVYMPKITKSELDKDTGALICDVDFKKISLFYREVNLVTEGKSTDSDYAFKFNGGSNKNSILWDSHKSNKFRSASNMNIVVDSDSYEDSPCKLIIYGPVKNPTWTHYVDGSVYNTGKVHCNVPAGYCLVVDTIEDFTSICIYDESLNNLYMDVYQLSDFSTSRLIYIKHGKNSIQVSSESADIVTIKIQARLSYVTV